MSTSTTSVLGYTTTTDIAKLTGVAGFSDSFFASFATGKADLVAALGTYPLSTLSASQLGAFDTEALQYLSSTQLSKIPSNAIAGLSTDG